MTKVKKVSEKLQYYVHLSLLRQRQGHRSAFVQFLEMAILYIMRGIGPGYYHSAQLWSKDKSWKYKLGWLSEKNYRKPKFDTLMS